MQRQHSNVLLYVNQVFVLPYSWSFNDLYFTMNTGKPKTTGCLIFSTAVMRHSLAGWIPSVASVRSRISQTGGGGIGAPTPDFCKYIDQNFSAIILIAKRSTGVTPGMNLKNPLHTGDNALKRGDQPWL